MSVTVSPARSSLRSRVLGMVVAARHRPLVAAAAALTLGVYAGTWRWASPALLAAAIGLVTMGGRIGKRHRMPSDVSLSAQTGAIGLGLLAAFAALGAFRAYVQSQPGPYDISRWIGSGYVHVMARIVTEPEVRSGVRFVATPLAVRLPTGEVQRCNGLLSCRIALRPDDRIPRYGDTIAISGTLVSTVAAPDDPSAEHLRRHGVFAALSAHYPSQWQLAPNQSNRGLVRTALSWRNSMLRTLSMDLPAREAALVAGIALGGVQGMSGTQADAFRNSGLIHIVAASGANVAILVAPLLWLTRRLYMSLQLQAAVCCGAIAIYSVAAGAQPAVTRAAIMAVVYLAAPLFDRDHDAPTALAAAALVTLLWDPGNLADIGFLLSFTIVAALIAFWPTCALAISVVLPHPPTRSSPLPARLLRNILRGAAATVAVTSIAATAAAPLTAQVFNMIPTLGIIANPLVAPALVVLLPVSLCAGLIAPISPEIARIVSCTVLGPLASYIGNVAETTAAWDGAILHVPSPGWPIVILFYAGMAAVAIAIAPDNAP